VLSHNYSSKRRCGSLRRLESFSWERIADAMRAKSRLVGSRNLEMSYLVEKVDLPVCPSATTEVKLAAFNHPQRRRFGIDHNYSGTSVIAKGL
jgi:hypothetical protein